MTRQCAICSKRIKGFNKETTVGFKNILLRLGHPNWKQDKAHPSCVRKIAKERTEKMQEMIKTAEDLGL